jgi:hypothetical protein
MGAKIYTGTGPSLSTESDFSVGNIFRMMSSMAETKQRQSEQLLDEAKFQYQKDTADKLQRSMTRLSDIGSGFNWETTISDPSSMFGTPLPSVKDAYDKYSKGQLADGVGVSAGAFQNMYNASAIRNLNMQIGSYNAIKAKLKLAQPQWQEEDYDTEMAKKYHADNLFTKYTQLGGGLMDQVSAVDPTTGQAVQLMNLEYSPRQPKVGLGERLMGLFKDPYTDEWRGTSITGLGAAGLAGLFTKRQAGKGMEAIVKHAQNVNKGGLDEKAWSKIYGKKTKKQVLKEAKSLAYKGTTLGKLAGKTKGALPYAAPFAGKAIGSLAGDAGEKVGHAAGIAGMAKALKVPAKAKSFGRFLLGKIPKILGTAGTMALADSPAPGIADLMALGFTVYEIKNLFTEWNKGQAGA